MTLEIEDYLFEAESLQAQCAAKEARASNLRARAADLIEEASKLELEALELWHKAARLEEAAHENPNNISPALGLVGTSNSRAAC